MRGQYFSGDLLNSIYIDVREMAAELPEQMRPADVLVTYVAAHLERMGYPLQQLIHAYLQPQHHRYLDWCRDHCYGETDQMKVTKERHHRDVFGLVSDGLAKARYNGEELMVTIHTNTCVLVSFRKE